MPVVLRAGNLQFKILLNDHDPAHVHVVGPGAHAKIYIATAEAYFSRGFNEPALRKICDYVSQNKTVLMEKWNEIHEQE